MQEEIVQKAVKELRTATSLQIRWHNRSSVKELNGTLDLSRDGQRDSWEVEIKKEVRNYHLPGLFSLKQRYSNLLLIAESISPQLRETLKNHNIAYLDVAGNAYIESHNYFIFVDGRKRRSKDKKSAYNRIFTRTGLRVVFLFLLDGSLVNATYRDIAGVAQVALGNIPRIMNGLQDKGYLLKIDHKRFKLSKKRELFQRWMLDYEEKLKPTLHLGNFRFMKNHHHETWKEVAFDASKTLWGGEPAGDILTGFLRPENLTVYTEENRANLMKNYHLVPDDTGDIRVFKKFWPHRFDRKNSVPPLLVYADLLNSGDARNIEVARLIQEQYLEQLI